MSPIQNNSEILFIYDGKMTNPNGDMDNENKPRMDYDTDTNLVSDVRLKRYIRDYFETVKEKEIFVTKNAKDAKDRGNQIQHKYLNMIDVKLFGAVYADKGGNDHKTGPVQFNWGYSLNPVEIMESSTITSSFSDQKGIGKDFRVKYSLIAFNGSINALVAKDTEMNDNDLAEFDKAMVNAIPYARTRSKIGQTPRLYLRVELENKTILKDLREYISIDYNFDNKYLLRSIDDYKLNIDGLISYLKDKSISKIFYWKDDNFKISGWDNFKDQFKDKLELIIN